jgi:2-hydroxy-6-oxonona-2,4-dienedioate hydrolase
VPATSIDDCSIYYEVLGDGPTVVLTPGGRNPLTTARLLAEQLAADFRVILWDRANIGRSDVQFRGARDLDLWLASGGPVGERLAYGYYGQFAELAEASGMAAVASEPYWAERIEQNPANRARLLAYDPIEFGRTMRRWQRAIRVDDPLFGATEDDLRRISVPTAILGADEDTGHPRELSVRAAELIPNAEYLEDPEFQAEWPGLQRQALANYEQPKALPRLLRAWLQKT